MRLDSRNHRLSGTVLFAVLFSGACGERSPAAEGPTVRDSAGVTIVSNTAPSGFEELGWTVGGEPVLAVGQLEGEAPWLLSGVTSPLLRSDGVLVLGNRGTGQLRAFSPDGDLVWEAGGAGSGPGEFEALSWVGLLPGDSLLVNDGRTRRVSIFDPEGTFVRSYTPERMEGAPTASPVALFDGGVVTSGGVSFSGGSGAARELVWDRAPHFVSDTEGRVLETLPDVLSQEFVVFRDGGSVGITEPPISRTGFITARGDRIVIGDGRALDLAVLDAAGRPTRRVRMDLPTVAVDGGDRDRALEARLGPDADDEARRALLDLWTDIPLPDFRPVADGVRLESDGTLWVRRWAVPWEEAGGERWWVFDPEGRYRGMISMPNAFSLAGIHGDRLVGVHTDALGVEQVRVYALER
jgi:hypothetical protein